MTPSNAQALDDNLAALLKRHELQDTPQEIVTALAGSIRRAAGGRPAPAPALRSRERSQAIHCAEALLRHMERPPRRKGATDDRRLELIALIDSLHAVVKVAASSGTNLTPALQRLKEDAYSRADICDLIAALRAVEPSTGAARANAAYLPLLRGGVMAWEACGKPQRYTHNAYMDETTGPLPAFLRDLIALAGIEPPTRHALHKHLRAMKKL